MKERHLLKATSYQRDWMLAVPGFWIGLDCFVGLRPIPRCPPRIRSRLKALETATAWRPACRVAPRKDASSRA